MSMLPKGNFENKFQFSSDIYAFLSRKSYHLLNVQLVYCT